MTELRERLAGLREASGREAAHLAAVERQRDEAAADLERASGTVASSPSLVAALRRSAAGGCTTVRLGAPRPGAASDEADAAAAADLAAAQAALREALGRSAEAAARSDEARHAGRGLAGTARRGAARLRRAAGKSMPSGQVSPRPRRGRDRQAVPRAGQGGLRAELDEPSSSGSRRLAKRGEPSSSPPSAWPPTCRERLAAEEFRLREVRGAAARLAERRAVLRAVGGEAGGASVAPTTAAPSNWRAVAAKRDVAAREGELAVGRVGARARRTAFWIRRARLSRPPSTPAPRPQRNCATSGARPTPWRPRSGSLESLAPAGERGRRCSTASRCRRSLTRRWPRRWATICLAGTEAQAPRYWREPLHHGACAAAGRAHAVAAAGAGSRTCCAPRLAQIGLIEAEQASAGAGAAEAGAAAGQPRWRAVALGRVRPQSRRRGRRHGPACATSCACTRRARSMSDLLQAARGAGGASPRPSSGCRPSRDRVGRGRGALAGGRRRAAPRPPARRRRGGAARRRQRKCGAAAGWRGPGTARPPSWRWSARPIEAPARSVADETEQAALAEAARGETTAARPGARAQPGRAGGASMPRTLLVEHTAAGGRRRPGARGSRAGAGAGGAGEAAREAGEVEAERRARETALGAELSELRDRRLSSGRGRSRRRGRRCRRAARGADRSGGTRGRGRS